MPTLTGPITAQGAIVDILVGVSSHRVFVLRQTGRPIPQPTPIRAVLDTGSYSTCIDSSAIAPLGLPPSGTTTLSTASTGARLFTCDEYDVSVTILHPSGNRALDRVISTLAVADLPLSATGIPALIGWDLLHRWVFHCDGPAGIFSLDY